MLWHTVDGGDLMSIYILSDPNIVDFVPEKNHQEIAMVKALNQKRIPVKLLAGMEDTPALLNDPSAMLLISHTLAIFLPSAISTVFQ